MDAEKAIEDVVKTVKSEGLFDQFRKECIEEFEEMDTYRNLKLQVESHVENFLSKYQFQEELQKNQLRSNLRHYISKSDILINSVQQLVDEVLSIKGHSFCLRIDKEVDRYLHTNDKNSKEETDAETTEKENTETDLIKIAQQAQLNNDIENTASIIKAEEISSSTLVLKKSIEEIETGKIEVEQVSIETSEKNLDVEMTLSSETVEETTACIEISEISNVDKVEDIQETTSQPETNASSAKNIVNISDFISSESKIIEDNVRHEKTPVIEDGETEEKSLVSEDKKEVDRNIESREKKNNVENISDISDDEEIEETEHKYGLVTEPISDDSASNDSSFNDESKQANDDDFEPRRKSGRVRSLPQKLREIQEEESETRKRNTDDTDSVSSVDIERNRERKQQNRGRKRNRTNDMRKEISISYKKKYDSETVGKRKRSPSTAPSDSSTSTRSSRTASKESSERKRKKSRKSSKNRKEYSEENERTPKYQSSSNKRTRKQRKVYSPS